jgi:hypothetical protein
MMSNLVSFILCRPARAAQALGFVVFALILVGPVLGSTVVGAAAWLLRIDVRAFFYSGTACDVAILALAVAAFRYCRWQGYNR